jgi:hypothetical protein
MFKAFLTLTGTIIFISTIGLSVFPAIAFPDDDTPVKFNDFPASDLPSDADRENLIGESAKNYYYGIGVPVDYVKARLAALLEMDPKIETIENEDTSYYSPPTILMMIYANGFGAKKNIDLAVRLAKNNVGGTPSEKNGRINHIEKMNNLFHGIFDVCDDIPADTGLRPIYKAVQKQDDLIREMVPFDIQSKLPDTTSWTPEQIKAFVNLENASNDYFSRRIYEEVEGVGSGSARDEYASDETNRLESNFLEILSFLEKGKLPNYSLAVCLRSDGDLKQTYNRVLDKSYSYDSSASICIRVVQRRWVIYQKAWVQFAALRYPKVSGNSLRKVLADNRDAELLEMLNQ